MADLFGLAKANGIMLPGQGLADATKRVIEAELAKRGIGGTVAPWAAKADDWAQQQSQPVGNAFTSMSTFGERVATVTSQMDALGVKVATVSQRMDDWNTKLANAPADMQTIMARYLSEV